MIKFPVSGSAAEATKIFINLQSIATTVEDPQGDNIPCSKGSKSKRGSSTSKSGFKENPQWSEENFETVLFYMFSCPDLTRNRSIDNEDKELVSITSPAASSLGGAGDLGLDEEDISQNQREGNDFVGTNRPALDEDLLDSAFEFLLKFLKTYLSMPIPCAAYSRI